MAYTPMAQGYANAYRTQMDDDMNQAIQNGLLALNYRPAAQMQQPASPALGQQGFASVDEAMSALGQGIQMMQGHK